MRYKMTLHIWSRLYCRWVRWRGTLAAWKLLPHAVVTATCTITLGSLAVYHLHVEPVLPVVPVQPVPRAVYTAGIGYLNPWHSFEVDASPPWVGVPGYVRCEQRQDHDKDDCKRRTVPEPTSAWLMLAGLGLLIMAGIVR